MTEHLSFRLDLRNCRTRRVFEWILVVVPKKGLEENEINVAKRVCIVLFSGDLVVNWWCVVLICGKRRLFLQYS